MHNVFHGEGLKKLNPRSLPEDSPLPSSIQKFLNKAPKPIFPKEIISPSKSLPKAISKNPDPPKKPKQDEILYQKQLEYSRNYSKYIEEHELGKQREDLFPNSFAKMQDLPLIPKKDTNDSKVLVEHLLKPKTQPEEKKIKLKGRGIVLKPPLWCARCSRSHDPDLHFKAKPSPKPQILLPHKRDRAEKFRKEQYSYEKNEEPEEFYDFEDDYDEEDYDFIVPDEDEERVKKMVRKVTGFDPSKYREIDRMPTYGMESSASRVLHEEKYSAKVGKYEDQIELERLQKKKKVI
jgi:hypothetical protein